jgi:hypothetical protein
MIDTRREASNVYKQLALYQNTVGEAVIWFKFDPESTYDSVYDEGGRNYLTGISVPILWVDQIEDPEFYSAEGRRPTQRIRFACSARTINETSIDATEAHGGRTWDDKGDKPWWNDRLNDVIYYDGRFYEISNFQIRGRARQDFIIGVSGIETQPEDERVWDLFPTV